jgi:hypothetical protein
VRRVVARAGRQFGARVAVANDGAPVQNPWTKNQMPLALMFLKSNSEGVFKI